MDTRVIKIMAGAMAGGFVGALAGMFVVRAFGASDDGQLSAAKIIGATGGLVGTYFGTKWML